MKKPEFAEVALTIEALET